MTASAPSRPPSRRPARPSPRRSAPRFGRLDFDGLNGNIKFTKQGPAGKESGQSIPTVYLIKIENGKVVVPKL